MRESGIAATLKQASLAAILGSVLAGAAGSAAAQETVTGESLVVVSWGGIYARSQQEAFLEPFTKMSGLEVISEDYRGGLREIRAQVQGGDVYWDVVDITPGDAEAACEEGLLERLPLLLPPAPDGTSAVEDFLPGTLQACAVGSTVWSTVLAVDSDRAGENQPDKLADLFNLADFPGRRGLRKTPKVNLEWALIADGVPAAEVYQVLASNAGVARAFAKLDTIKDQIVWWESGEEPGKLLDREAVIMTSTYSSRIFNDVAVEKKPYSLIWDHQVWDVDLWAVPKGAQNKEQAIEFVRFATGTVPLASFTKTMPYGPARRSANALAGPYALAEDTEMGPLLPTSEENFAVSLRSSAAFWSENGEKLVEKFNLWVTR